MLILGFTLSLSKSLSVLSSLSNPQNFRRFLTCSVVSLAHQRRILSLFVTRPILG